MFIKISGHPWGTKQSHVVTSCLWCCLKTIDVLKSHFVPSCFLSCLTTIEVINSLAPYPIMFVKLSDTIEALNSLILSHRVCEVVWHPLRYQTVSICPIVFVMISDHPWGTKQSHFVPSCLWSDNHSGTKQSQFVPLCLWSCLTTIEV